MLALLCHAVVTQRPLVVETHSYPAVASDDQPDRSAAHKNLDTYKYYGQVIHHKHSSASQLCSTSTMWRLPAAWPSGQYLACYVLLAQVWGGTAEVCLASEWLRGRSMLTRILLYTSGCTKSIPTWNYEPRA